MWVVIVLPTMRSGFSLRKKELVLLVVWTLVFLGIKALRDWPPVMGEGERTWRPSFPGIMLLTTLLLQLHRPAFPGLLVVQPWALGLKCPTVFIQLTPLQPPDLFNYHFFSGSPASVLGIKLGTPHWNHSGATFETGAYFIVIHLTNVYGELLQVRGLWRQMLSQSWGCSMFIRDQHL